jgi:hypothetical protein
MRALHSNPSHAAALICGQVVQLPHLVSVASLFAWDEGVRADRQNPAVVAPPRRCPTAIVRANAEHP